MTFQIHPATIPSRLGLGPMSRNSVDACIAHAYRSQQPLMLIPSRRQVEAADLGGGYVESWSTEQFVNHVKANDPKQLILLCRDHGGPYQHPRDRADHVSPNQAMRSALASFTDDIHSGFDLLHIDTCMGLDGSASFEDALDRLVELYGRCWEIARSDDRTLGFEVGLEGQGVDTNSPREFEEQLQEMLGRLLSEGLPPPVFVVAQTGTKVMETENVGALRMAPAATEFAVRALCEVAEKAGVALKAHNADYLSFLEISRLSMAGVHAMNVAPELGVAETRAMLAVLDDLDLKPQKEQFLTLAYNSRLWVKWMAADSAADDVKRAVIAGHYVFGSEEFVQLKSLAADKAARRGVDLDAYLRWAIDTAISRYATALSGNTDIRGGSTRVWK